MEHVHAFTNVTADSKRLKRKKKNNNNNNYKKKLIYTGLLVFGAHFG